MTPKEQAEQEPVAEVDETAPGFINWTTWKLPEQGTKLYAAPVQQAEQEPVCNRCNGTKVVSDGLIDNIGGAPLEVPIGCVKDCPDCVAPVQPVKQKPVAEVVTRFHNVGFGRKEERKDIQFLAEVEVGTKLYAAPQTVSQEPVAWKHDCAALCMNDVELWINKCPHCGKPRNVAPVRTKDLTDDEIACIAGVVGDISSHPLVVFARAVIAADREKNKCQSNTTS